ncbi:MAG TPA: GNAT family N-acetyltransferase [Stellaceae bacterium]|nr:GNAT family N-acetyltransferase [Stellaceae bacterium]
MTVPATQDALRARRRKKYWYNIDRQKRLFETEIGPLQFEVLGDDPRLGTFLDQVHALFLKRWSQHFTLAPWRTERGYAPYRAGMLSLVRDGAAELLALHSGGRLLSFGYCLIAGDGYYFYQHAADPDPRLRRYSLGKILVVEMVRHVVSAGRFRTLDFMIGTADYKLEWADRIEPVYYRVSLPRRVWAVPPFIAWSAGAEIWFRLVTNAGLKARLRRILESLLALRRRDAKASAVAPAEEPS